jgi:hypothetical protein
MDADKLEELERLLRAGTPGPWRTSGAIDYPEHWIMSGEKYVQDGSGGVFSAHDAALICAAINALPELIESARENAILKRLAPEYFRWTGGHDQTEDPEWACDKLKYGGAHFENIGTPEVRLVVYDDEDRRWVASPGDYIVKGYNGLWVLPALKGPTT